MLFSLLMLIAHAHAHCSCSCSYKFYVIIYKFFCYKLQVSCYMFTLFTLYQ